MSVSEKNSKNNRRDVRIIWGGRVSVDAVGRVRSTGRFRQD